MTDNDITKVGEMLRYLGIDPDVWDFDSRVRIQKITYILKSMGVSLKYSFRFYRHGVYSDELHKEYFNKNNALIMTPSISTLNAEEVTKLNLFKKIDYLNNDMLKAISSIIFYELTYENQDYVAERVKRVKPELSHDTVLLAQNHAKILLFRDEYLTKEVREELQVWDSLNGNPDS